VAWETIGTISISDGCCYAWVNSQLMSSVGVGFDVKGASNTPHPLSWVKTPLKNSIDYKIPDSREGTFHFDSKVG
jgi:hypothetical protein